MALLFTQFFYNFVPIASVLAIIHLLFVSLMYMASKILSNEGLLAFSRHEFAQALYSAIIIGSVIASISVTNNIFCTALSGQGLYTGACDEDAGLIAHVKVARAHLAEQYNNVRVLAKGSLRAFDWAATASSASLNVGLLTAPNPLKYAALHAFIYGESFSILTKALVFLKLQELFLVVHSAYFFPSIFNMGLVFRMVPFTRRLGGLLMGIALSLFFVLPYMYILSQVVIEGADNFSYRFMLDTSKYAFAFMTFGGVMGGQTYNQFDDYISEIGKSNVGTAASIPSPSGNMLFGTGNDYYNPDSPETHNFSFVEVVARIVLAATFSSIFSIVGAISAIREISSLFGGDVEIAGLTRII